MFKRWLPFGLLSSHSRLHGSSSYRVPWAFDDEAGRWAAALDGTVVRAEGPGELVLHG